MKPRAGSAWALVAELVHLHGGRVSADSDGPGRGAEFTVSLPLYRGANESDSKRRETG